MKLCRFLRWKGVHDVRTEQELIAAFARNEVPYSCLKTCQPWGPDEALAVPEDCDISRECFELSPRVFVASE
jgi:hypothetical protein